MGVCILLTYMCIRKCVCVCNKREDNMADDVVLVHDAVAAQAVTRFTCDLKCLRYG